MQNELSTLIQLQTFDAAVDALRQKAESLIPLIQSKTHEIESLKSAVKAAKDRLQSSQIKRKELEGEADAKEKQIQKFQSELNTLKSNDAYKAMLTEIESAKQALRKIEDDILALMEAAEQGDKDFKEKERVSKGEESRIQGEIKSLEDEKNKILADAQAKEAERNVFAATVPAPLKDQYEAIREKKGGLAIVPLRNNACGGCHMSLPPNKIIEVRKAKAMILCESCMRILYFPQDDAPAPVPPSVPASTPTPN